MSTALDPIDDGLYNGDVLEAEKSRGVLKI